MHLASWIVPLHFTIVSAPSRTFKLILSSSTLVIAGTLFSVYIDEIEDDPPELATPGKFPGCCDGLNVIVRLML